MNDDQYKHVEQPERPGIKVVTPEQMELKTRLASLEQTVNEQADVIRRLKKDMIKLKDNLNIISVTLRNK
jgi:uncharacterized protein YdcH (DUF465 family)